ncbi:hypothetical protein CAPTEDRAFT_185974 [Capitella teleta]|uniref:Endonuclease/exonuclease/phosphatase domain-containing protein n=1 Tax=Capitella teleta TaxID=283909 RepID=R7TQH4_CAPTE|nr:hypothetical protein CAPTEDRAFT_185974 [Capitella teleta]|eukprot:ELT96178.1 hypothetical protein CAPTEDRAFT_185974 [Capitella teleta]
MANLTIATYNANGCAMDRRMYLKRHLDDVDVLFVQEQWLNEDGIRGLQQDMDNAFVYGKSGMNATELLVGRPYGGLAILFNTRSNRPSIAWHRASDNSIAEYKRVLALLLTEIPIPDAALRCPDQEYCSHREAIALYSVSINAAGMAAAEAFLRRRRKRYRAEHVAPFKEMSVIWHRIWEQSGRPPDGLLFDLMRQANRDYKSAVRSHARNQDNLSNARMADSLTLSRSRDFWAEVKKISYNHRPSPSVMDGIHGDEKICERFRDKYDEVYNCVPYDVGEMDNLRATLSDRVVTRCQNGLCYCDHSLNVNDVNKAIRKLKKEKSGGDLAPSSDHYLNAPRNLHVQIALLLSVFMSHSFFVYRFTAFISHTYPQKYEKVNSKI